MARRFTNQTITLSHRSGWAFVGCGLILAMIAAPGLIIGVTSASDVHHDIHTVTDLQGSTHMCYGVGSYYSDLWYAKKSWDGRFYAEKVDGGRFGDVGYDAQIQVNNWGVVIAYRSGKHYGDLWLASKKIGESSWTKVLVDDGGSKLGDTGYDIKVDFYDNGSTYLEYRDKRNNRTMLAISLSPRGPFTIREK